MKDDKLRDNAVAMLTRTIERYKSDTELPDYAFLMPSAQIDFACLMEIISTDDYYMLHDLLDKAKKIRAERSV